MIKIDEVYKKQNPWVSLLRIFMCFVVIQDHFSPTGNTLPQILIEQFRYIAVPCFMFLSFFFMGESIKSLNIERIKNRILRLYIPIFVWNITYWICKNVLFFAFHRTDQFISINGLIEGLVFSAYPELASQLWFLFSQIIILIIVCIFLSYAQNDRNKNTILILMTLGAFVLEYMGINSELFESSMYVVKYSMGRTVECIPFATLGLLYSWNLKNKTKKEKSSYLAICVLVTVIARFLDFAPFGFGYSGIYILFSSAAICGFILSLPDTIHGKLRVVINYVGAGTMGIYCLHMLIGWGIIAIASQIQSLERVLFYNTLIFDAIIFVICFGVTLIIKILNEKLNWRWIRYTI